MTSNQPHLSTGSLNIVIILAFGVTWCKWSNVKYVMFVTFPKWFSCWPLQSQLSQINSAEPSPTYNRLQCTSWRMCFKVPQLNGLPVMEGWNVCRCLSTIARRLIFSEASSKRSVYSLSVVPAVINKHMCFINSLTIPNYYSFLWSSLHNRLLDHQWGSLAYAASIFGWATSDPNRSVVPVFCGPMM